MKAILLALMLLTYNVQSQNQHLQYEFVIDSHVNADSTQLIDNAFQECGHFTVTIDTIFRYKEGDNNPSKYVINMRTLDLDCKCYYNFTHDDILIVISPAQSFVLVAKLNTEIMYVRTYYLKQH